MGVALGRLRQQTGGSIPYRINRRTGITLVEVLVVIGIIVMLAGILLPVLSHVWESSRRTKCASNLREIGKTCMAFADRHQGYFPMCYRMRDTPSVGYPYYVPFCISQGTSSGTPDLFSNDNNPNYWRVWGTSWTEWQASGANLSIFTCPSSSGNGAYTIDLSTVNSQNATVIPGWGAVVWIDYMYVGGLSYFPLPTLLANGSTTSFAGSLCGYPGISTQTSVVYTEQSIGHWGTAVPAVQTNTGAVQQGGRTYTALNSGTNVAVQTDTFVLAADMCFQWNTTTGVKTNHPLERKDPRTNTLFWVPDFQNVLYSDGSVRSHGQEDYMQPLNTDAVLSTGDHDAWNMDTGPNWSLWISPNAGGYCYWGEGESIAPILPSLVVPIITLTGGGWPTQLPPTPNGNPVLETPPPPPPAPGPLTVAPFNQ